MHIDRCGSNGTVPHHSWFTVYDGLMLAMLILYAGCGYGSGDESERRLWHTGAGLCGGEREHKSGEDHSELYGCGE